MFFFFSTTKPLADDLMSKMCSSPLCEGKQRVSSAPNCDVWRRFSQDFLLCSYHYLSCPCLSFPYFSQAGHLVLFLLNSTPPYGQHYNIQLCLWWLLSIFHFRIKFGGKKLEIVRYIMKIIFLLMQIIFSLLLQSTHNH